MLDFGLRFRLQKLAFVRRKLYQSTIDTLAQPFSHAFTIFGVRCTKWWIVAAGIRRFSLAFGSRALRSIGRHDFCPPFFGHLGHCRSYTAGGGSVEGLGRDDVVGATTASATWDQFLRLGITQPAHILVVVVEGRNRGGGGCVCGACYWVPVARWIAVLAGPLPLPKWRIREQGWRRRWGGSAILNTAEPSCGSTPGCR